jgi:acyl-ACP thioesterase
MWLDNKKVWSETYTVRTYEIDKEQRASAQSICRYLFDAAGNHADTLGFSVPQMFKRGLTWMLSRFFIQIHSYPRWRDELIIQTWPSGVERFFALRDFTIFNRQKKVVGAATSAWVIIDLKLRRPLPAAKLFNNQDILLEHRSSKALPDKLPPVARSQKEQDFNVRYSDLDLNGHVTSASYIDWLLEIIPAAVRKENLLKELELNFISEAMYGDSVKAVIEEQKHTGKAERLFNHGIVKNPDSAGTEAQHNLPEIVRAGTRWS